MLNLISQIIPIISFVIGFYFGFSIKKEDKLPEFKTPIQKIEEIKQEKKEKKKKDILDQYMDNLDNYPNNQKQIKE